MKFTQKAEAGEFKFQAIQDPISSKQNKNKQIKNQNKLKLINKS
jgi:hypothetical protein